MVLANHRQHKSRNAAGAVTLSLCCGLFALGRRIEVKVKAKFREGLERYGEKKAIFFHSLIVTNYATERGDPARQIPVNGVALLFESFRGGFILLLDSDPPVIVDAIIPTDQEQAAVVKEGITIQIAMSNIHLKVGYRLHSGVSIYLGKTLGKGRHLRVDSK